MNGETAVVRLSTLASAKRKITDEVLVGKDILELLTGAMYVDPLSIFREYVQNACDAIDEAKQAGVYEHSGEGRIDIVLDPAERSLKIRDTGAGIQRADLVRRLTAIGGSRKRDKRLRGFRGVGRLSGLGYAQELIFRTRGLGEDRVSEITWDGRRLRELLRQADYAGQLADVVREVAQISTMPASGDPPHFFEVELRRVTRLKNDILLNEQEVRAYLSQVAPVPFHPEFSLGGELSDLLRPHGLGESYQLTINDGNGQVYRPHRNALAVSEKASDRFESVRPLKLLDMEGAIGAVGWVLHHSYYGAIPKRALIGGLRLRTGNLQVGSEDLLAGLFPEQRFNAWCVGEIHLLGHKVLPNGRRDDFEPSVHYDNLKGQLGPVLRELAKTCRDSSALRNRMKHASAMMQSARDTLELLSGGESPTIVVRFVEGRLLKIEQDIEKLLSEMLLSEHDRDDIRAQYQGLKSSLAATLRKTRRSVIIRGINAVRRSAYEDVLTLIYELTPNPAEAHTLASRIVDALRSMPKQR